jgi:hypothetical protein
VSGQHALEQHGVPPVVHDAHRPSGAGQNGGAVGLITATLLAALAPDRGG